MPFYQLAGTKLGRTKWKDDFYHCQASPVAQLAKNLSANAGDTRDAGSIPPRSPREGNDNPIQYSCLENSTDRGAWQATVHGVSKDWTQLRAHTLTIIVIHDLTFSAKGTTQFLGVTCLPQCV